MSTLKEIQVAIETLPREEQEELYRFLGARSHIARSQFGKTRVLRQNGDTLLEASADAPLMSVENVKQMLED